MILFCSILATSFLVFDVCMFTEQAERKKRESLPRWENWQELETGYRNY